VKREQRLKLFVKFTIQGIENHRNYAQSKLKCDHNYPMRKHYVIDYS
jgi:hypothetical protein